MVWENNERKQEKVNLEKFLENQVPNQTYNVFLKVSNIKLVGCVTNVSKSGLVINGNNWVSRDMIGSVYAAPDTVTYGVGR